MFLLFFPLFLAPPFFCSSSSLCLLHISSKLHLQPPQQSTYTEYEDTRKAVNDKDTDTLALFSQPHHHFTRPLPSTTTHHATGPQCSLTHCVQQMPISSLTMTCKHFWSCNTNTTAPILTVSTSSLTHLVGHTVLLSFLTSRTCI